jgi:hypothetical protein
MDQLKDDVATEQRLPVDGLEVEEVRDVDTLREFMREWQRSRLRELHERALLALRGPRADGMIDA